MAVSPRGVTFKSHLLEERNAKGVIFGYTVGREWGDSEALDLPNEKNSQKKEMLIFVQTLDEAIPLRVQASDSVEKLKSLLALKEGLPAGLLRVFLRGWQKGRARRQARSCETAVALWTAAWTMAAASCSSVCVSKKTQGPS